MVSNTFNKMTIWVASLFIIGTIIVPIELNAFGQQYSSPSGRLINGTNQERPPLSDSSKNSTAAATTDPKTSHKVNSRLARSVQTLDHFAAEPTSGKSLGDSVNLATALESHGDLMVAAGEHGKKYILVKKKPKPKKIKMEVYEPKMKYKKIKMKVPVKTMKKKKVKGYLVKKHHHH